MSKWLISLASIAMLAFAMSGCGGSDGSSSTPATSNTGSEVPDGDQDNNTRTSMNEPDTLGSLPPVPMVPAE
jgi:hypothetical protein